MLMDFSVMENDTLKFLQLEIQASLLKCHKTRKLNGKMLPDIFFRAMIWGYISINIYLLKLTISVFRKQRKKNKYESTASESGYRFISFCFFRYSVLSLGLYSSEYHLVY